MTTKQAHKTLMEFNAWRRGDDETLEQPHPKDIGEAIDHACIILEEIEIITDERDAMAEFINREMKMDATDDRIKALLKPKSKL
jgi:hypothetical protein